eukprot:1519309-Pyramimonas_sp.AAC.1
MAGDTAKRYPPSSLLPPSQLPALLRPPHPPTPACSEARGCGRSAGRACATIVYSTGREESDGRAAREAAATVRESRWVD